MATSPSMPLLGREQGTQVYRELDEHPTDDQVPGVVVLRLDGGLFFATSDALEDRVREVALSTPDVTGIVLDCEGIDFIDSQGTAKMGEILDLINEAGVAFRLARVKPAVADVLRRDGFLEHLGEGRTHGNVHRAVEAQMGDTEHRLRTNELGRYGFPDRVRPHPDSALMSPVAMASTSALWSLEFWLA